jgi:methionyl-tRNA formyltransferase
MKISVVVDNPRSWFVPFAEKLGNQLRDFGDVSLLRSADDIHEGNDIAFLLSCEKKVGAGVLRRSSCNVVVHASELPRGKGMSPLTWQVLEGRKTIPLSLFEAVEEVDAGPVYLRGEIPLCGNELLGEMRALLGAKIVEMCVVFFGQWPAILNKGIPQTGDPTIYRRRLPEDSRLDPHKSIAEQFNLLRISDNERYPAFVEWLGRRYNIKIEAAE